MPIMIDGYGNETYIPRTRKAAMTEPTLNPTEAGKGKARGIRVFKPTEAFTLIYNPETSHYDLAFEGKQHPIRFVAPEAFASLINPLAAGMKHKSGRHSFTLEFEGDRLVEITNDDSDAAEGETVKRSGSVNVTFNSPIKDWIRVIAELPVEKALRLK
jgi:hypothetical protein